MWGLLLRAAGGFCAVVLASSAVFGGLLAAAPGAVGMEDGYVTWLLRFWGGVLTGDLGASYRGIPIVDLVLRGASRSLPIPARWPARR